MLATAGMRATPHIRQGRDLMINNSAFSGLISELAMSCGGALRRMPQVKSYNEVDRRLRLVAPGIATAVHVTLGEIAAEFGRTGLPVGRHLAVDGSLFPAWVPQKSSRGSDELEAWFRRRSPQAGFIAYTRDGDALDERIARRAGKKVLRAVRGYRLTSMVDLATGLVLAFDLRDPTTSSELGVLRDVLLPRMFDVSPSLEVTAIVGDGRYDDKRSHEHLETHYGIHLVAARGPHLLRRPPRPVTETRHPTVAGVKGNGIAICREHKQPLLYKGLTPTPAEGRRGLSPGDPVAPSKFRSRFECPEGHRVSFPTRYCWSDLPYYPYTPHGRPDLYATRIALLAQRNQVETFFSAMQVGYKQCLDGAARVRVYDHVVTEALIALAIVTRALISLANFRSGH
jgi:hypothetical protein